MSLWKKLLLGVCCSGCLEAVAVPDVDLCEVGVARKVLEAVALPDVDLCKAGADIQVSEAEGCRINGE